MTIQYIIVAVILLLCLTYIGWRISETIKHANDKCYGCSGCAIHKQLARVKKSKKK